jgi:pyruvate,orthophosphate dikinase
MGHRRQRAVDGLRNTGDSPAPASPSRATRHRENKLYGEFLINAQGEDVVAGSARRTDRASRRHPPGLYDEFFAIAKKLENHYHDMQDMEFTVENGKLYMHQTRNGKRTAAAALKLPATLWTRA